MTNHRNEQRAERYHEQCEKGNEFEKVNGGTVQEHDLSAGGLPKNAIIDRFSQLVRRIKVVKHGLGAIPVEGAHLSTQVHPFAHIVIIILLWL